MSLKVRRVNVAEVAVCAVGKAARVLVRRLHMFICDKLFSIAHRSVPMKDNEMILSS